MTECFGLAVGCLLSPPEKILLRNGTRIQAPEQISDIAELKALGKIAIRKDFLLVLVFTIMPGICDLC